MSEARDAILSRVRRAVGRSSGNHAAATARIHSRMEHPPRGPQPGWDGDLVMRFCERLEAVTGSLTRVSSGTEALATVREYLSTHGLALELTVAPHPLLSQPPWSDDPTIKQRPLRDGDANGVTVAFAGIAETGSLVLLSGPETPTAINFLVDNFICLLPEDRIVPHLEDAWDLVRVETDSLPRALNIITGPSRTADVEQTIQLGAHGPRRLHVVLC